MVKTICVFDGYCPFKGGYCRNPDHPKKTIVDAPSEPKEKKPIPKESAQRKEQNKAYRKIQADMRKPGKVCKVNSPVCIKTPVHAHHQEGRVGDNLTDEKKIIDCCD